MTAARAWRAWGCTVRLVIDDEPSLPAAAEQLAAILGRIDRVASRFRPDSSLSRANAAAGKPVPVPLDLVALVGAALDCAERTNGAVDPMIGADLARWGYDRDFAEIASAGPCAGRDARSATWRQVRLNRELGLLTVPAGAALDLGATAKAFTADFAATTLARRFQTPVLVELGGDVAVAGERPGGWCLHVAERTGGPGQQVIVHHGGLATSTTTVRQWRRGRQVAHHIIDPRTGAPTHGCWRTASVAADSALSANTASTAVIVLGDAARPWLEQSKLAARLVDQRGQVTLVGDWPAAALQAAS